MSRSSAARTRKPRPLATEAEIDAGVRALNEATQLKSTKADPRGAVRAILEAAAKQRAQK